MANVNIKGQTPQEMSAYAEKLSMDRIKAESVADPGIGKQGGTLGYLPTGTGAVPITQQALTWNDEARRQAYGPTTRPTPDGGGNNPYKGIQYVYSKEAGGYIPSDQAKQVGIEPGVPGKGVQKNSVTSSTGGEIPLDQFNINSALNAVKSGSYTNDQKLVFDEAARRGLINPDQALSGGQQQQYGTLSSDLARGMAAEEKAGLASSMSETGQFFQGILDRLDSRTAEDTARLEKESIAAQEQLKQDQAQEVATQKATSFKLGRTGTMYGVSEMQQLTDTHRAQMLATKSEYEDLILQSKRALEDGQIELAKEYRIAAQNEVENAIKMEQLYMQKEQHAREAMKYEREEVGETLTSMAKAGFVPSEDYLSIMDKKNGWEPGRSAILYAGIASDVARDDLEKDLANAKSTLEIQDLQNQIKNSVFNDMKIRNDVLAGYAAGEFAFEIDGKKYYGTQGTGGMEIDEQGIARISYVDQETGDIRVKYVGKLGAADAQSYETVYVNGVPVVRNKKTGQVAAGPDYNASATGALDFESKYPQGSTLPSQYDYLQCGEFQHFLSDDYPSGLNTWQAKAAAVTIPVEAGPMVGNIVFHKTNAEPGHVARVNWVGEDDEGKTIMRLTEANYDLKGTITHDRIMYADDPRLLGYRESTVKQEFQQNLAQDKDTIPGGVTETYQKTTGGLDVTTPSPFLMGTQSETQYQAGMAKEQTAQSYADLLVDGTLSLEDVKKEVTGDITARALNIARANGYTAPGDAVQFKTPDFNTWLKQKEDKFDKLGIKDRDFGDIAYKNAELEYSIQQNLVEAITNSLGLQATEITPQRYEKFQETVLKPLENGNYDLAIDNLMTEAIGTGDADSAKQWKGVKKMEKAVPALRNALDEFYSEGGSTGLLEGGWENVQNKIGESNDPRAVKLKNMIQTVINAYRYTVTGAAFTASEAELYDMMFPSISKGGVLNDALLDGLMAGNDINRESLISSVLGENFNQAIGERMNVIDIDSGEMVNIPVYKFDSALYKPI